MKLRFEVLVECNYTCQYCGRKAPEVEVQVDHIIPQAKGGTWDKKNLIVACSECNIGKSDKILEEFK